MAQSSRRGEWRHRIPVFRSCRLFRSLELSKAPLSHPEAPRFLQRGEGSPVDASRYSATAVLPNPALLLPEQAGEYNSLRIEFSSRPFILPIGTAFHERTFPLCQSLNYREWSGYYTV